MFSLHKDRWKLASSDPPVKLYACRSFGVWTQAMTPWNDLLLGGPSQDVTALAMVERGK